MPLGPEFHVGGYRAPEEGQIARPWPYFRSCR
jgi:hypothetical protein